MSLARHRTALVRPVAAALGAVVLVLGTALAGDAAPPDAGSWTRQVGPGGSYGSAQWNANTNPKRVYLVAEGYALPRWTCETIYFDWNVGPGTGSGHYDARAARDCRSSGYNAAVTWLERSEAARVDGVHKLRVCHGTHNTQGTCANYPGLRGGVPYDWSGGRGVTCVSWGLRNTSGVLTINSGGDPRRCDA